MKKNLEISLSALQTDHLDYFFIHEPLEKIDHIEELIATGEKLKQEGKIKALGLSYMRSQEELHSSYLKHFDILQFNASAEEFNNSHGLHYPQRSIQFSPFQYGTSQLTPEEKILKLHEDFPESVILCSMFSEKHIRQNTQLFT